MHDPSTKDRGQYMSHNRVAERRSHTRNKVLAISAAGAVLAAGITIPSLAAWTDIEWIAGLAGGGSTGVSTQSFNVEQLTALSTDDEWGDYETQGSPNYIDFTDAAAALTPGDTVYAWVQLRTEQGSLGGELSLGADTDTSTPALAGVLTYGARIVADETACTQAGFDASTTTIAAPGSALDADGTATFELEAAPDATTPGEVVTLCFALTLPGTEAGNEAIQGQTVTPIWHFDAVSIVTP